MIMTKKVVNFNLGSRGLTAEEVLVVDNAKKLFLTSLERHRQDIVGHAAFASRSAATAVAKAAAKPAAKSAPAGSAAWTSGKIASAIRKY